jgi:signal transduction histidine kinase
VDIALRAVVAGLQEDGLLTVPANDASRADTFGYLPRFGIVDCALPGALQLIRRVSSPVLAMYTLALLPLGDPEGPALAAGAWATLRQPIRADDALLLLRRFRVQHEQIETGRRLSEAGQQPHASPQILEEILTSIGHEIRNPLAAALANVEVLREPSMRNNLSEEELTAAASDTVLALQRIQEVISSVSVLMRGSPPVLEKVEFWKIAEQAAEAVQASRTRIEISGERHIYGWASAALLERVVINLLQNAQDATAEVSKGHILMRVYRSGTEARISVRDNGPGVPYALRQRIFEPFFLNKGERGTGVGLALMRHAVERMGGQLTLGPSERGTVFRVHLRNA